MPTCLRTHACPCEQGEDPLEPFGVYDTRTAQEIYEPAEEGGETEGDEEAAEKPSDPSHPQIEWWHKRVREGPREPAAK
jgi:hypothetical protein